MIPSVILRSDLQTDSRGEATSDKHMEHKVWANHSKCHVVFPPHLDYLVLLFVLFSVLGCQDPHVLRAFQLCGLHSAG
jgi:hypothetical protein